MVNKIMTFLILIAVALAVIPLIYILAEVFIKGGAAVNLSLLTHLPVGPMDPGGGVANALAGSFIMVGIATAISVPIGVGAGIFFSEWHTSKLSTVAGFMNDVLTGFPSMVLGLFVFIIIVVQTHEFSAFAGAVALSFVMIPIIARTTDESLKLVANSTREASMALGIPRWKTIFRVVLSTGKTGVLTGIVLAIARATGETAPLLLTAGYSTHYITSIFNEPTSSLTYLIYYYGTSGFSSWEAQAWGAALILIFIMLVLNLFVKLIIGRNLKETRIE